MNLTLFVYAKIILNPGWDRLIPLDLKPKKGN